jgi:Leucine-rich repeat (LRR) protein
LESLDISGNQFYSIPSGIGKLKHLLKFFASNNKIERIADELLKCSALTTLDLRNNQIKELPSTLSLKLKKLTLLLLDGNPSLVCKEGQKISRF